MVNSVSTFNKMLLMNKDVAKIMLSMTTCIKGFKPILKKKLILPSKFAFIWMDDYEAEVKVYFYFKFCKLN